MYHEFSSLWKKLINQGLKEDGSLWDWTTLGVLKADLLSRSNQRLSAKVVAKSEGIWAAETLVCALAQLQPEIRAVSLLRDGQAFTPSQILLELHGDASVILKLERPFLNLATYVCGIATQTAQVVQKVNQRCQQRPPRITLTRKTLPGYRDVAIHAVRVGGGYPHRVSLSGGILIKENHIAAARGIRKAIEGVREKAPHGLKVEIEVCDEDQLKEALQVGVDGVLLDNFSPQQVNSALNFLRPLSIRPFVEVSGGLNHSNIEQYAIEGVDVLSLGWLTHSVEAVDLSLLVD